MRAQPRGRSAHPHGGLEREWPVMNRLMGDRSAHPHGYRAKEAGS